MTFVAKFIRTKADPDLKFHYSGLVKQIIYTSSIKWDFFSYSDGY